MKYIESPINRVQMEVHNTPPIKSKCFENEKKRGGGGWFRLLFSTYKLNKYSVNTEVVWKNKSINKMIAMKKKLYN